MSMYITFRLCKPIPNELTAGRFDYVPRVGEAVLYDDKTYDVHSVEFDISKNSVTVNLKGWAPCR
jgi:hypothetical protein